MDIDVTGKPERKVIPETIGTPIRLPLTAEPDQLLMSELANSQFVASYLKEVEVDDAGLLLFPTRVGQEHVAPMLTAVKTVIVATNERRRSEENLARAREQGAATEHVERIDAQLDAWWQEQQD